MLRHQRNNFLNDFLLLEDYTTYGINKIRRSNVTSTADSKDIRLTTCSAKFPRGLALSFNSD